MMGGIYIFLSKKVAYIILKKGTKKKELNRLIYKILKNKSGQFIYGCQKLQKVVKSCKIKTQIFLRKM